MTTESVSTKLGTKHPRYSFFFQMEDNALFHGEMILRKWQKYIDECNNKILCVIER